MAKAKRRSAAANVFWAWVWTFICIAPAWLLPGCSGCRFDTSPLTGKSHDVERDDNDSGESK